MWRRQTISKKLMEVYDGQSTPIDLVACAGTDWRDCIAYVCGSIARGFS